MSETATLTPVVEAPKPEVKPEPPRKPRIGQEVWFWLIDLKVSDPPLTPEKDPCCAKVAGFDLEGRVNLSVLKPNGLWVQKMGVPYSHDPKGNHWTLKN